MNVDDVKALIAGALQAIKSAERTLDVASADAREALTVAAATTHDSAHPDVEAGLAAIRSAQREIELITRRLAAAADHAEHYQAGL